MPAIITTEIFVDRAKIIQSSLGRNFDYSKVDYKKCYEKVEIICPKHGSFWQTPTNHLQGNNCPCCVNNTRKSLEKCIQDFHKVHSDKFDYSKVANTYKDRETKVEIICKKHNISFWQSPKAHMQGRICCPECISNFTPSHGRPLHGHRRPDSLEKWIVKFKKVHGDNFDYSKAINTYVDRNSKIEITCKKHNITFWQAPANHVRHCGCPKCTGSHLEKTTFEILTKKRYKFEEQKTFEWLVNDKSNSNLYIDFYLPNKKVAIECQGVQHFKKIEYFHRDPNSFKSQLDRDKMKKNLCEEHGITMLYFAQNADYIKNADYEVITDVDELIERIKSA